MAALNTTVTSPDARSAAYSELDDVEQLVLRYRSRLLRLVSYAVGDTDLAQSIVQDTLMRAYKTRSTFRGEAAVFTWLARIAMNLVRDHQRSIKFQFWKRAEQRSLDLDSAGNMLFSDASTPEQQLIAREKAAQVGVVLKGLPATQRTAFLLRYAEELEIHEIAHALGTTINTARSHLFRATKAVRIAIGGGR